MANPLTQGRADFASSSLYLWGRVGIVLLPAVAGLAMILTTPRVAQNPAYHRFADQRAAFGVARFGDVVTNAAFVLVGAGGLVCVAGARRRGTFAQPREAWAYAIFFAGVTLTGVGSAWYHRAPTNDTLLWDRLPMAVAFMALFSAVIAERLGPRLGVRLLPFLLAAGVASVFYWHRSESLGSGDLRPYYFVQFYPIAAIPLLMLLFPARYTHSGYLWGVLGWYVLAKVVETLDRPIFALTRIVSGHNLKHILAAVAILCVVLMLRRRRPTPASHAEPAPFPRGGPQPGERRY